MTRVPERKSPEIGYPVRLRDGNAIHDDVIHDPTGCPRRLQDCQPLARYASPGYESFVCCGETDAAPVIADRLRFCIAAHHRHGVNIIVNLDERDAVHSASVLLAGLSALGSVNITASAEPTDRTEEG